jgi:large subunit ribosomal protein L35
MSKLKTHRGAAKRFRRTANGRIKCRKGYRNHILTKQSTKVKRHMRGQFGLSKADTKLANRMLAAS